MVVGWHRPTRLHIDTQAITENVQKECQRLPEGTALFAVVKANGYGHGAVESAKAAKKGGATGFCVALLDEAIELREAGVQDPILILSVVDLAYVPLLIQYDLSVTVATQEWLEATLQQLTPESNTPLRVHLKVDTGMGRIGFLTPEETKQAVRFVQSHKNFYGKGFLLIFQQLMKSIQAILKNKQGVLRLF